MNSEGIVFAAVLVIAILLLGIVYRDAYRKERDPKSKIAEMAVDAFFIAILMIMTFVPSVGYIAVTPFLSFTLIHLPVLLGAALFGPRKGMLYGFFFGVSSYVQALNGTSGLNALFAYPWVAIPPRMLFGLIAGLVFSLIGKLNKSSHKVVSLSLASALLTITHTILVFADLLLFFPNEVSGMLFSPQAVAASFTFLALIGLGMSGEALIAAVVVPPLYLAVSSAGKGLIRKIKDR